MSELIFEPQGATVLVAHVPFSLAWRAHEERPEVAISVESEAGQRHELLLRWDADTVRRILPLEHGAITVEIIPSQRQAHLITLRASFPLSASRMQRVVIARWRDPRELLRDTPQEASDDHL